MTMLKNIVKTIGSPTNRITKTISIFNNIRPVYNIIKLLSNKNK